MSNNTSEPCEFQASPVPEPKASSNFRVIFMSTIVLFSLVGNGLVLRGAINRRNRPFSYCLLINLSVAELVISVFQPLFIVFEVPPYSWIFGHFMCKLAKPLSLAATLVVTFTLAAIAMYRCIMLIQPHRRRPNRRTTYLVIGCSWIWGITLEIPSFLTMTTTTEKLGCNKTVIHCNPYDPNEEPLFDITAYFLTFTVLLIVVPFILMLVSYGVVVFKLKRHIKAATEHLEMDIDGSQTRTSMETVVRQGRNPEGQNFQDSPEENQISEGIEQHAKRPSAIAAIGQRSRMVKLEIDVLNMIYFLILIFFVCYIPPYIYYIAWVLFEPPFIVEWNYNMICYWYLSLLFGIPSALHPICYGAASNVLGFKFRLNPFK